MARIRIPPPEGADRPACPAACLADFFAGGIENRYRPPCVGGAMERIVLWGSRLALPVIAYLLAQILYWLWFDNLYVGNHVGNLIGGMSLGVVFVLVLVLAFASWCLDGK